MAANVVIRARIDESMKEQASVVLEAMGLTLSDAIRLLIVRIANEKALPFSPLTPREETLAAVREMREGKGKEFTSVRSFMDYLHADD